MIHFDPKKHKYTDDQGREYISVTTLLSDLFPFDRNEIAKAISENPNSSYYKWSIKDIFKDWRKAATEGNKLHGACENYITEKKVPTKSDLKACVKKFAKLKFKGKLLSEQKVYSEKYLIAGTIDIIEDCGNILYLYDLKTYKKITDDRIHKLNLQLEIYRRLAEERFGRPCKVVGGLIFENFVVDRENTNLIFLKAQDAKEEVDKILENRLKEISNG